MVSELDLDRAFADKISESDLFMKWVIQRTKYAELADYLILLNNEQAAAKPSKKPENWWRHWWCRLDDGSESETDIFLVFKNINSDKRIAFHIEDKPPHGKFTPNQYLNYERRARHMSNKDEYMNYSEFTTILLAPKSFIDTNKDNVQYFDTLITYEDVSEFIPLFADAINFENRD